MADTISEAIQEGALGPKKASGDSGSIEQRPISELLEADNRRAAQVAAARNHLGLRFTKLEPPGAG